MSAVRSWDVFCHVVDNFGDAAVCWRLSCALADEVIGGADGRTPVRLWIDDLDALRALQPGVDSDESTQSRDGVEICHLADGADFGVPADVAVDAFGGGLPDEYANALASRTPKSLWIVLEYLSAEPWVVAHHGLPSPHPRLPVDRYFFFPGFEEGTGGLLREAGLAERREAFLRDPRRSETFWRDAGFAPAAQEAKLISLFGYENSAVAEMLDAWACGEGQVVAAVPQSRLSAGVAAFFGASAPSAGTVMGRGSLEVRHLPFLAQCRYDELLWAADWNFVRGEDSFVRAQWAERPFVWHIYPQKDAAHLAKLEAFLERYCAGDGLQTGLAESLRSLWFGWNGSGWDAAGSAGRAWSELAAHGDVLRGHAHRWAAKAAAAGDLAKNLAKFCQDRLK
ncbi:MAG: hypothetical protein A3H32_19195 [Betaproteobacteria bacterium RIFCSPLOWO2_02_FULL_63_19]|nr:MAG: hypothetical protein A3H32_19195 [Betaproteobacteria bacterium RIFCSPLOWO2_02_FULL_63_19]